MVEAFYGQAFIAIQERIQSQVPEIAWVDQDLSQLEHYEIRPAVQFPCVLVDFINSMFKEEGGGMQWGETTIQLRIGFDVFSSANSAAPLSAKEAALKYYEIENSLFKALNGWTPEYNGQPICDPIIRVTAATELREDAYRVRVNQYTTAFEDGGSMPVKTTVKATMKIN